jgi:hypothetical protein
MHGVPVWEDERVLEMGGGGCITNVFNAVELYA